MRQIVLALILPLAFAACDDAEIGGPEGPPSELVVAANNALRFNPSSAELAVGGVVTFSFGTTAHTVNFAQTTGAPANVPLSANSQVQRTFTTTGTYNYSCTVHTNPPMTGTIIVR